MNDRDIIKMAAGVIRQELAVYKVAVKHIVLFGSHARKTASPESDWDFLVTVERELTFPEKVKVITAIQRRLAEKHISVDVILKSEKKISQEINNVGLITYYALKEGVTV